VDTTRSSADCGGCGLPCASDETCINAACVPISSTYVVANTEITDFAVDDASIYWIEDILGTVNSTPIAGGAVTVLASAQANPASVAIDSTNVYWSETLGGAIMTVPKNGGAAMVVAATPEPTLVLVDATNVYWVSALDDSLQRVAKPGGNPTLIE